MKNSSIIIIGFCASLLSISGCATAPLPPPTMVVPPRPPGIPGSYHTVSKGETLWRISKTYNIELDKLVSINQIADSAAIEVGQMLFIPYKTQAFSQPSTGMDRDDFVWPIKGKVTSSFGSIYQNLTNKGINIQPSKTQEVVASRAGKVVFCSENFGAFGKTIVIEHPDNIFTVYAKNSELLVKPGSQIPRGTAISRIYASNNREDYLHFEIRKGAKAQNPNFFLPR